MGMRVGNRADLERALRKGVPIPFMLIGAVVGLMLLNRTLGGLLAGMIGGACGGALGAVVAEGIVALMRVLSPPVLSGEKQTADAKRRKSRPMTPLDE